MINKTE